MKHGSSFDMEAIISGVQVSCEDTVARWLEAKVVNDEFLNFNKKKVDLLYNTDQ